MNTRITYGSGKMLTVRERLWVKAGSARLVCPSLSLPQRGQQSVYEANPAWSPCRSAFTLLGRACPGRVLLITSGNLSVRYPSQPNADVFGKLLDVILHQQARSQDFSSTRTVPNGIRALFSCVQTGRWGSGALPPRQF